MFKYNAKEGGIYFIAFIMLAVVYATQPPHTVEIVAPKYYSNKTT